MRRVVTRRKCNRDAPGNLKAARRARGNLHLKRREIRAD
jgi:hypothetical protein